MLRLSDALRERLVGLVRAGYPSETCGLLIGSSAGERVQVDDLVAAHNLERTRVRDRYELDPADFVAADRNARARGLEIVGIWHSHPDHPARPSSTDLERAWEGWSYLIASVAAEGAVELRSWRLAGAEFVEEDCLL